MTPTKPTTGAAITQADRECAHNAKWAASTDLADEYVALHRTQAVAAETEKLQAEIRELIEHSGGADNEISRMDGIVVKLAAQTAELRKALEQARRELMSHAHAARQKGGKI